MLMIGLICILMFMLCDMKGGGWIFMGCCVIGVVL